MEDSNISAYDRLENLRFDCEELKLMLNSLENNIPEALAPKVWALKEHFETLSDRWFGICDYFTDELH